MSGNIKKRNTKRRMTAGVILAAAVLAIGGVAAGAAANWDSSAIFTHFLKAEEPVDYSLFENLGMEINETMDFGDFTVTVNSILTDGQIVYVLYEYTLPDAKALYPSEKNCYLSPEISFRACDPESGFLLASGGSFMYDCDDSGVYHCLTKWVADPDKTLEDAVIAVRCSGLNVTFGKYPDGLPMTSHRDYEPQMRTYSTEDIPMEFLCGSADVLAVLSDADIAHINGVKVSALSAQLLLDRVELPDAAIPANGSLEINNTDMNPADRELVAVYADGTERTLSGTWDERKWRCESYGTVETNGSIMISFSAPISLEGLTAVRYLDTEIPVG